MTVISTGDMAQQFSSLRSGNAIKSELLELTRNLSSGRISDVTKSLNGETARFSGLQYSLSQLDGYLQVARETQQTLANVQIALNKVDGTRGAMAERLLLVNDSSTGAQIDQVAQASRAGLQEVVTALNTQLADRALLSGNRVNTPPLVTADAMLADLQAAIGATTDPATIRATVDDWFNDPAGGFFAVGYLGDTGPTRERRVTEDASVAIDARADDPAIRQVMEGAALAALASALPALDQDAKRALLQEAAGLLQGGASGLVAVQARVGVSEARVDRAMTEMTAQQTALRLAENDIVLADPFETASRLQAKQLQLETFFSVTARLSQLSLLRFI